MIKRLYVDNFKCLVNFEIKPSQISCLLGPNGGGKSAIFSVLQGLQGFLTAGLAIGEVFPPLSRTRWDARLHQRIELDVQGTADTLFHYELLIRHDSEGRNTLVEREALLMGGNLLYEQKDGEVHLFADIPTLQPRVVFPFDPKRSFLPLIESRPDNKLLTAFKKWLEGIWLFALRPSEVDGNSPSEALSLEFSGKNFPSWYRSLMQEVPAVADKVRIGLGPVIPGLKLIKLVKISPEARFMMMECELSKREFALALNELSDGQRSLLMLYTILHALTSRASLLVFDEPDNFVTASEIQPWLSQLRQEVVDHNQGTLLVISHHPEVIDYLSADQALLLWRTEDGPTRLKEVLVDRETGMTASEWLRNEGVDAG